MEVRAVFKGIYGIKPIHPQILTSFFLHFIYCHIKQKYCIFFSSKTICDSQKVLKRRLRSGLGPALSWGSLRRSPRPPSRLGRGETPRPIPTHQHLRHLISVNLLRILFCIRPWWRWLVTAGAVLVVLSSSHIATNNKPAPGFFCRPDAFPVTQQTESEHCGGKVSHSTDLSIPSSPGVFQPWLWPLTAPGYLGEGLSSLSSAVWRQQPSM